MAFDLGAVVAHIKADITDFKKGVSDAQTSTSGLKDKLGGLQDGVSSLFKVMGGIAAAVGVSMAFKDIVNAATDAQKEMAKFDALMQNTFGKTPEVLDEMKQGVLDTAEAFIKLGFDDEATANAMAKSIVVTKDLTESQKEMALAADFARLKGIGIEESQRVLQMAYMGNQRVLKQYGIELEDSATKMEIFTAIQNVAGGQAEAFSNTYAGASAKFAVEFENLKETLGEVFLPILTQVFSKLSEFVNYLNSSDLAWFRTAVQGLGWVLGEFATLVGSVVMQVIAWFNTYLMPFVQMLVVFFQENWAAIYANIMIVWNAIMELIKVAWDFVWTILSVGLGALVQFMIENWDHISAIIMGAWEIIKGIVQTAWSIVYGIISVGLAVLKGDWSGAWEAVKTMLSGAWDGIKGILNGALDFIKGWGGWLFDELTKPFRDAWATIEGLINKIKDGLDFTKKHSPSVVDIVSRGVGLVNKALGGLAMDVNLPEKASFGAGVLPNGKIIGAVYVDMKDAFISDSASATRMGEKIGDSIVKKLQYNVRF